MHASGEEPACKGTGDRRHEAQLLSFNGRERELLAFFAEGG